jgi:pilus assembly protein CpaF
MSINLEERIRSAGAAAVDLSSDRYLDIKTRLHKEIIAELGALDGDSATVERQVVEEIRQRLAQEPGMAHEERVELAAEIKNEILGYGPLANLMEDDNISEIMVNGPYDIWIESSGRLSKTPLKFTNEAHLRRIISKMVGETGRRIDESSPMVDARLPDGSRLNAVIPPLAVDGSLVTIRKFSKDRYSLDDLARMSTLTPETVTFLDMCVRAQLNILISGGTGSGKTTLLNALSGAIPDDDRIVTIEDAAELQLNQRHVLRMESRQKNIEGEGEVGIRELVRNALRMRPDRIVVGETRGAEALDMLQAMNTGHDGSLSTVHANTPRDALARLETMVMMAGYDLPSRAIRQQICSALDMVIHIERIRDGSRRVTAITEVQRMENDVITMQDIFKFETDMVTDSRQVVGSLRPLGLRPSFFNEKFEKQGLEMPNNLFIPPGGIA